MLNSKFTNVIQIYEKIKNSEFYEILNIEEEQVKIFQLQENFEHAKFSIVLIGEFNVGKSTLINSLIERDLLPSKYIPTTNNITAIKNTKSEYVRLANNSSSEKKLSKENILELNDSISTDTIEIGLPFTNLSEYILYDTPGVNDSKLLSEKIIFDLISSVDIVLFVMNINQGLGRRELSFLKNLVHKKDFNKFFFILNQKDKIIKDDMFKVKQHAIESISKEFLIPEDIISQKVVLYSAKEALAASLNQDNSQLHSSGQKRLISGIELFIKKYKKELLKEQVDLKLSSIVNKTLLKVNTQLDIINSNNLQYESTLQLVQKEIKNFEQKSEDALYGFRRKFDNEKINFKEAVRKSFESIVVQIEGEVDNLTKKELSAGRNIEKRLRFLVEESLNEDFIIFSKRLVGNFEVLNSSIDPIFKETHIVVNDLVSKNISPKIVKGLAIGAGVVGAVIYTPTILTIGAVGLGISALAGGASSVAPMLMAANPVAGMALSVGAGAVSGVINTAGVLAVQAGKLLLEVASWISNILSSFASDIEGQLQIKSYKSHLKVIVNSIETSIIKNIDEEFHSSVYIEAFLKEKFPEREALQQRIVESQKDYNTNMKSNIKNQESLQQLTLQLQEYTT